MSRGHVILAVLVAGDRRDLVGLDDQVRLETLNGLAGLLSGRLIRIADCNQHRHSELLLSCLLRAHGERCRGLRWEASPDWGDARATGAMRGFLAHNAA